jgi:hypothetical protein
MPARPEVVAERRATWSARVARYEESGLPLKQFAAKEKVQVATLQWWLRRVRAERQATRPEPLSFVSLQPVERASAQPVPFDVSWGNGHSVRVWPGFDGPELVRLVSVLREAEG